MRPGTVAVRARGPARYYGGEQAAALTVLGIVAELGVEHARVGIADGLFAAERAARWVDLGGSTAEPSRSCRSGEQGGVPGAAADHAARRARAGGRCSPGSASARWASSRRSRSTMSIARFGPMGARLHALAAGRDPRPATPRIPPRDVDVQVDFEPPLDRVDQVAFGVRAAADDFVTALLAQRLVCTALRVELFGENGDENERVWLHPRSFTAAEVVDRRARGSCDGAGQTSGLGRRAGAHQPGCRGCRGAHERGLWGTGPDEGVHSGLSRVQGMVGHQGVLTATAIRRAHAG